MAVKIVQNIDTGEFFALKTIKTNARSSTQQNVENEHKLLTELGKTKEPLIWRYSLKNKCQKANIIMKYEKGISIKKWLATGPLSENQLLDITQKILKAYQAFIDKNILHCDLKLEHFIYDAKNR